MNQELAKTQSGALAVPDHLKDVHSRAGFENVTRDDVVLPRLSICQAMSPQRKKANPNFIEGLSDGDLFNTVSGQVYGTSVMLIPMLFTKSRIYFRSLAEGGGILCQSFNGVDGGAIAPICAACPNSQFEANGQAPACSLFMNYPVVVLPQRELAVLSMKSTGLKVAKQWNSRMKLIGDKPMFAGVYKLVVVEQSSTKGNFFSPTISFNRFVDADEFQFVTELFTNLKGQTIRAHDEGLDKDAQDDNIPF